MTDSQGGGADVTAQRPVGGSLLLFTAGTVLRLTDGLVVSLLDTELSN